MAEYSLVSPLTPTSDATVRRYAALSLTTLISVLILIVVGSIVRVTGNGLGCPDWPLCHGQIVPPLQLSAWIEFSHRFMGALTGAQIVWMSLITWQHYRQDQWRMGLGILAIVLLILQVSLGGIHVIFELPPSSGWMHTGVAMALAGTIAAQVGLIHPALQTLATRARAVIRRDGGLPIAVGATAVVTYFLILSGSYVTRSGASLACPAFPDCGSASMEAILPQLVGIQMFHRFMAFGVALTAGVTLWRLARAAREEKSLRGFALGLAALIVIQFGLGISNVLLRLPLWSRILHLLDAALLWTGLVMLWVILWQGRPQRAPQPSEV